jgi:hypothetical protein
MPVLRPRDSRGEEPSTPSSHAAGARRNGGQNVHDRVCKLEGRALRERWEGPCAEGPCVEAIVNVANNNGERLVPVLVSHSRTLGIVRARHRPSADTRPS